MLPAELGIDVKAAHSVTAGGIRQTKAGYQWQTWLGLALVVGYRRAREQEWRREGIVS